MIFEITDLEEQRANDFIEQQMKIDSHLPTSGERWTYMITPTGLGQIVRIKDERLNKVKDVTDWDNFG